MDTVGTAVNRWLLVVSFCLGIAVAASPAKSQEQTQPLKVEKVLYLVHPHIYEGLEKRDPQLMRENNYQVYRDREKICQQRWIEAIDRLGPNEIFAQLYGAQSTLQHARQKLGDRRVIAPSAAWNKEMSAKEYHDGIADSFRKQLQAKNLEMDLDTVTWELAGESFEGCAFTYGSGMASSLGVKKPTVINFDLCVPDARFLCTAQLVETFPVDGTDVNAYVFAVSGGYPVGVFLPGLRDTRTQSATIELGDPSKVTVVNKCDVTLFSRKGGRGCPGPDRDHGGITATETSLTIPIGPSWYIKARMVGREKFLAAMRTAKITSGE